MADLMVDLIASLDGYGAGDGWPGYWGLAGTEYLGWLEQPAQRDQTVLMGANTYRLLAKFAEQADDDSLALLTATPKVVFSSTLQRPLTWANTRLIDDDAVAAVRSMKKDGRESLHTVGSLTLSRALLQAGLVDRLRVVVFPVITGKTGREPIYQEYPDVALEMVTSRTFDGRLQLLEYVPTVLAGPPGAAGNSK